MQVLLTGIRIRNRNKKYLRSLPVARARQFYYSLFLGLLFFCAFFLTHEHYFSVLYATAIFNILFPLECNFDGLEKAPKYFPWRKNSIKVEEIIVMIVRQKEDEVKYRCNRLQIMESSFWFIVLASHFVFQSMVACSI